MTLVISLRGFVLLASLHALPRGRATGCAKDGSVIVMDRNRGSNAAFHGRYAVENSITSADGRPVFRKLGNGRPAYLFYLASYHGVYCGAVGFWLDYAWSLECYIYLCHVCPCCQTGKK